jgi:hypothetical protein
MKVIDIIRVLRVVIIQLVAVSDFLMQIIVNLLIHYTFATDILLFIFIP